MATDKLTTPPARRGFLALLTGSSAALALPAVATTAPTPAPAPQEAPELIALGERLDAAIGTFKAAVAARDDALAVFKRTRPAIPDELQAAPRDRHLSDNLLGFGEDSPELYRSRLIRAHIAMYEVNGRTKEGRRLHRLARLATNFEKQTAAALAASGYDDREREVDFAAVALRKEATELSAIAPRTMAGLLIYARAAVVMSDVYNELGHFDRGGSGWMGRHLAEGLLRVAGRA
jgi:hypothetical protein